MMIHLVSPVHFEKWDWRNSVETGIGGSETAATELAWRFARRGYSVKSYAPLPEWNYANCGWRGTFWFPLERADFADSGLWIVFRSVNEIDQFEPGEGKRLWLFLQDEGIVGDVTEERADKIEKVICLCGVHANHIANKYPLLKDKIVLSSNGVKTDLIRQTEAAGLPERNPKKLIYASSPDRGLLDLLAIFRRVREYVTDLELHCFYGCDNIEKLIDFHPRFKHYRGFVDKLKKELDQPGVIWRGRIGQEELYREWFSSGIWCYPTHFGETSCITCMEAQAMGAIPITNPYWALAENVQHGVFIEGNPETPIVRARYVDTIVKAAQSPEGQENIRKPMMRWARARFNWEFVVDGLEAFIRDDDPRLCYAQGAFQRKHSKGRILNVGCAEDPFHLKGIGAVNVDVSEMNVRGFKNAADYIGDARCLPHLGLFDTVLLGDILEHMSEEHAIISLHEAKCALAEGGRVVITIPDDDRPVLDQHLEDSALPPYIQGVSSYHTRRIDDFDIKRMLEAAGLEAKLMQKLDYSYFEGWGIVAEPMKC